MLRKRAFCPICGGKDFNPWGPPLFPSDFMPLWGMYGQEELKNCIDKIDKIAVNGCQLSHCKNCDGVFSGQLLDQDLSNFIYDRLVDENLSRDRSNKFDKKRLVTQVTNVLLELLAFAQEKTEDITMLDYGCGWGDFLQSMHRHGVEVSGVEFSEKKREFVKLSGINVAPSISQLQVNKPFDIILSWQVIEHLENPYTILEEFKSVSHPKTILLIGVPNFSINRLNGEFAKSPDKRSRNLNPLEHLTYFDGHTLTLLAKRAGWNRIYTKAPILTDRKYYFESEIKSNKKANLKHLVRKFQLYFQDIRKCNIGLGTYIAFIPEKIK